jgi:hypothetical protein
VITSAAPPSCAALNRSLNAAYASPTVTTGSNVDRIDAVDGPTRAIPAKKAAIAIAVDTRAINANHSHPSPENEKSARPLTRPATANVPVAPRQTSPASTIGDADNPARSAVRM